MNKSIRWLCVMFVLVLPATVPAQIWVARYNGPGDSVDFAYAIAIDGAGDIYVTGRSIGSGTNYDYATVKYDSAGFEQWVARYNGPGDSLDDAYAIVIDDAGDIYVTGRSIGSGTDYDYATVKYDSAGFEQWVARYNGPDSGVDRANAIAIDDAGAIYITGDSEGLGTDYDYATVKYDSAGVLQWVARYDGPVNGEDDVTAMAVDDWGNVYVTGLSFVSLGDYDYATVKYDSAGVEQWVAWYNGLGNGYDLARAIAVDDAGAIYITGASEGVGTGYDYATVKYDSAGVLQWVARYNGPGNGLDSPAAIAVNDARAVYVTGTSEGVGTGGDYATVKYDSAGFEQWVARYNGPGDSVDFADAIVIDDAGAIYVTGTSEGVGTDYDYATMKYDSAGFEQWVARYNGPDSGVDWADAIVIDDAGAIYVTGASEGVGTNFDYATIKYSPTGIDEQRFIREEDNYIVSTIFSGPLQSPEGTKCKVFDITGRVVEPSTITCGIYFLEIDNRIIQKIVKVR